MPVPTEDRHGLCGTALTSEGPEGMEEYLYAVRNLYRYWNINTQIDILHCMEVMLINIQTVCHRDLIIQYVYTYRLLLHL